MTRLTSRFEVGLSVDVQVPDLEHRTEILKKKLSFESLNESDVSEEVLTLIASSFVSNIRELEGALKRVLFYALTNNIDVTIETAQEALEPLLKTRKKSYQLSENNNLIALLPGSRKQEIKKILPIFLKVTVFFPQFEFVLAGAPGIDPEWYQRFFNEEKVKVIQNKTHELLLHAKAALVSSGTATLETGLLNVPQVVCYRSSFLTYQIAKWLVKLKYISLVNLILDREVVKELIQEAFNVKEVTKHLKYVLSESGQKKLKKDYQELQAALGTGGASKKTAQLIIDAM